MKKLIIKAIKRIIPTKIKVAVKRKLDLIIYKGSNYQCPLCKFNCKEFLLTSSNGISMKVIEDKQIIGAGVRKSRCPKCGSSDRERLVYLYLKEVYFIENSMAKKKILHIAPEEQLSKFIMNMKCDKYICGDKFSDDYIYSNHVQKMDITKLPLEDDYFDLIICNHVLEHIENDEDAIKELYRVLKKDGKAILQVPISKILEETYEDSKITKPQDRKTFFGQKDHVRIYGKDYTNRLKLHGFCVQELNYSSKWEFYGTNVDEILYIAKK